MVIFQFQQDTQRYFQIQLTPRRMGVQPIYTINLVRTGDGLGAHYSALWPHSSDEAEVSPGLPQVFSPVRVQPHPKARPRVQSTRGRKKRVSEILTDTPVKNSLAEEKRQQQKRKQPKSTSSAKPGKKKPSKGTTKARRQLISEAEEEEENEDCACIDLPSKRRKAQKTTTDGSWFCFLCGEDRQEDMIRCCECNRWVHTDCGKDTSGSHYVCDACQNDSRST